MLGAPETGPKLTTSPPICRSRTRLRAIRLDDLAPKPDDMRGVVDVGAMPAIDFARPGVADLEPALRHDAESGREDALDLLFSKHLERRHRVHNPRQRRETWARRSGAPRSLAASGRRSGFTHAVPRHTVRRFDGSNKRDHRRRLRPGDEPEIMPIVER